MQKWYEQAKLGIFLHWGIYAVDGVAESWSFGSGSMSYEDYMKQLDGFTASNYNPEKWAKLIKQSGARYAILTTKHHDGVCLFDTAYTDLTVLRKTPAGRDLLGPYCEAMRKEGLKVGIYFTGTDWSDDDHMMALLDTSKEELQEMRKKKTAYSAMWPEQTPAERQVEGVEVPAGRRQEWNRFLERYKGEIRELLTNYGKIDLFWTDAMLYRKGYSWDTENVKKMITELQPDIMVNGRLDGYGDFLTSEQRLPLRPISDGVWEYCHTFNESWGVQGGDHKYKDTRQVIRLFTECIAMGGNMLIGAGPKENGDIPAEAEKIMTEMGQWIGKYEEAIFPTERGLTFHYCKYPSTLSSDKKTLYLFLNDKPNPYIMLNGIRNPFNKITCLTNGRELSYSVTGGADWVNIPGCKWIALKEQDLDEICTVVKIEMEEPIDLWEIDHPVSYGAQAY